MRGLKLLLLICILFKGIESSAQLITDQPSLRAVRIMNPPEIDGNLIDDSWNQVEATSSFTQTNPVYKASPKFKTEVKIAYDDKAIYIGAVMYDSHPDSIKKEIAVRDSDEKNADYFYIGFDTWNNKQDAYIFGLSASGIQIDKRNLDETYNAVWNSAVKITDFGWVAEIKIPYSALRFPAMQEQIWGMQIVRTIRRNREEDQWSLEPKDTDNTLNYWGLLTGLKDIDPPLRLSLLPYISAGFQHDSKPGLNEDSYSYNYNGGMDLKWGLNESFTLDMILLPDFSQVQSDKIEKNLSPFEIVYDENRPFFNEGTDLFQKGDLFYSRRIGHVPLRYYNAYDSLKQGEQIISNPYSSRLINAVKLSGRTSKGLGLGIFNALTGNTYAVISDSANNKREVLTDPITNYNILVIDQSLPNNSSVYLINTNVSRPNGWKTSDVGGGGFKFSEKTNTYKVQFDLSLSHKKNPTSTDAVIEKKNKAGIFYNVEFAKTKGKFRFSLYQISMNNKYDRNDMGLNNTNDWLDRGLTLGYNIFEPYGIFRYFYQSINIFREVKITTKRNINTVLTYRFNTTFTNYLTIWGGASFSPYDRYDYWEPRYFGRFWIIPGYISSFINFSSDYRKMVAFDGAIESNALFDGTTWKFYRLQPIIRFSDRFKISPELQFQTGTDDLGFVKLRSDSIFFGRRDIQTITPAISGEYLFSNKLSLSIWLRHYWQKGNYDKFMLLDMDGSLQESNYIGAHDYNYNYFNIDLVLGWEFSPGSLLNIVWKNAIESENDLYRIKYFDNFDKTISSPQINNLSLKVLYYLDYQMLKKRSK